MHCDVFYPMLYHPIMLFLLNSGCELLNWFIKTIRYSIMNQHYFGLYIGTIFYFVHRLFYLPSSFIFSNVKWGHKEKQGEILCAEQTIALLCRVFVSKLCFLALETPWKLGIRMSLFLPTSVFHNVCDCSSLGHQLLITPNIYWVLTKFQGLFF